MLTRPKDVLIPLAVIWQFVPFQWSDLNIPVNEYRSVTNVRTIMDRFLKWVLSSSERIVELPRPILIEPELGIYTWQATTSGGGTLNLSSKKSISLKYLVASIIPHDAAFEMTNSIKARLRIPKQWKVTQDPSVCDFPFDAKGNGVYRLLGPGHKYTCPGKRFFVEFDSKSKRVATLLYSNSSFIEPSEIKISQDLAVELAIQALKENDAYTTRCLPYVAQIGLGYDFLGESNVGAVRQCYRIPFTNRTVVSIDAESGKCISICRYK